jgi:hypothetical protein
MHGMVISVLSLTLLGGLLGWLLGLASRFLKVEAGELEAEIEEMLPGSQCGQCGFPGCSPGAQGGPYPRAPLHRLHQVLQALSHRRHRRRLEDDPRGVQRCLYRLRKMFRGLPYRMYRDARGDAHAPDLVLAKARAGGMTVQRGHR